VFEELRRKVEGKVYGDIETKKAAIERELQQLAAYPEKVKSLTGWDGSLRCDTDEIFVGWVLTKGRL
jgi:hypothetical protein